MKQQPLSTTRFAVSRGAGLRPKVWILLILAVVIPMRRQLCRHPTLLGIVSHFLDREIIIPLSTPRGVARLVCNLSEDSELLVAEEILRAEHYIVAEEHDLLVDFGAFRGISTLFLADQTKAEQIVAVEPNRENFSVLTRRLKRFLPNSRCICAAVADTAGSASFVGGGVSGALAAGGTEVKLILPCDVCDLRSASNPVVKLDIEGAEEQVLPLLLEALPEHSVVFVETHCGEGPASVMLEPFMQRGYRIARLVDKNVAPTSPYMDWKLQK